MGEPHPICQLPTPISHYGNTTKGDREMDSRQRQTLTAAIVRMSLYLSVVIGLLGILGTPLAAEEPKHGGTLTVGLAADISHFDVFHALGYEAIWALEN